jgi:hypothetical protein
MCNLKLCDILGLLSLEVGQVQANEASASGCRGKQGHLLGT